MALQGKLHDNQVGKTRASWVVASLCEALLVGAAVFLIVALAIYGVWFESDLSALQSKRSELRRLASALSSSIDAEVLDKFHDDRQTNTPEFNEAVAPLRRAFDATPGLRFLYTVRLEDSKVKFVLDATKPGDSDHDGVEDQSRVGEVYDNTDASLTEALTSGAKPHPTASEKPCTDAWGTFISGFAPCLRKDGTMAGVLGVDIDARDFMREQALRRSRALEGLVPAAVLSLVLVIATFVLRYKHRLLQAKAEAEYRQTVRLAEIARRTASAVVVTGLDRSIEWVNEGFVRMTGHRADEVPGTRVSDLLFGDDTDPIRAESLAMAMANLTRTDIELRLDRKDGSRFDAKIEMEPSFDPSGRHTGFMLLMSDVTRERMLQQQLEGSEQRLRATFNSMAEGVVLRMADGTIAHANQAALQILGLGWDELLGFSFGQSPAVLTHSDGTVLEPDDYPSAHTLHTGQAVSNFLAGVQRRDGSRGWIRISTEPVYDGDGKVQGVVSSFADVTEFEEAQNRLASERTRLREFVAHAPAAIAMVDSDFTYIAVSEQWGALFGLDHQSNHKQTLFGDGYATPAGWRSAFRECLAGRVTSVDDEVWSPTPEIRDRHLRWECRPWHLDNGAVGGVLVSAVDTTEQVKREEAIRTQAAMLMDMNRQLDDLATRDPLTNLVNRRRFVEIVDAAVTRPQTTMSAALLYLDLDNFKFVNDAMGHDSGDHLLRTIAERLGQIVTDGVVARLGGDEFAVFLYEADIARATAVAGEIVDAIKLPVELDGRVLSTSFSVGVAPTRGKTSVEALLQQADMAMYYAKSEGKSCWKVYESWMSEETVARLQLESDLRQAWENRDFQVYYQPVVEAETCARVAAEALVRWKHDRRGIIGPDKFIGLLEEIGLIDKVGFWVMRTACEATQRLRWTSAPGLRVAVNVSGQQLKSPGFVPRVLEIIEETGLPADALTLEITETTLVMDLEANRAKLDSLRERGVKIAVDDFGTGYSSMGVLGTLPIDIVKIDKAFVAGMGDSLEAGAIMRALITLTKVLGLETVAEGIESESQFVQLHALGIDYCQGYYFSPPVEHSRYETWVFGAEDAA